MRKEKKLAMFGEMAAAVGMIEHCREFASLVPEVRTNIVYSTEKPESPMDVLAVDGRITVVDGMPRASGKVKFGASSHMARLIIEINRRDPEVRAGINFASTPELMEWLESYCKERSWVFSAIDRSREPQEITIGEGESMPWKIAEAVRAAGGAVPKVFYETGAVGKEPVTVLIGADPVEVAEQSCEIAVAYARKMERIPRIGKIGLEEFDSLIQKRLGAKDRSVIVPPMPGVDAGVVDLGEGKVLVVAEDPIFSIPNQPLDMFGWYTVHIGASDVAVIGVRPRYMTYTLLLPPGTVESEIETIVESIHIAAKELGIAIVGGHTGFYPGISTPLIGGVTVLGIADKGQYVTPAGAKAGDDVILTKGPAIETVGILSSLREVELIKRYDPSLVEKAKALAKQMSVVKDAMAAMEVGGVTAMHDATEGGVIGGFFEVANASDVGMEIDESLFVFPEEVRIVCEAFDIDPAKAIAEGSLIITARPESSSLIVKKLKESGIEASVVGKVTSDIGRRTMKRRSGEIVPLEIPCQDPFWPAFFKGLR